MKKTVRKQSSRSTWDTSKRSCGVCSRFAELYCVDDMCCQQKLLSCLHQTHAGPRSLSSKHSSVPVPEGVDSEMDHRPSRNSPISADKVDTIGPEVLEKLLMMESKSVLCADVLLFQVSWLGKKKKMLTAR